MAWKNSTTLFALVLTLVANAANAQEALWRVDNTKPPEETPAFNNNLSPFPIKVEPVKVIEDLKQESTITKETEEELQARLRAERAAEILEQIRTQIQERKAFDPDLTGLVVNGRIKTKDGVKVLIHDKWLAEGEKVKVPVKAAVTVAEHIRKLKEIDAKLAEIVQNDFDERVQNDGPLFLQVKIIYDKYVELIDEIGEIRTLPIVSGGF